MAVFDGLIDWWGWGDAADALYDVGTFAANDSFLFDDNIDRFGGTPHDGQYTGGAIMYDPSNLEDGVAFADDAAPWGCKFDTHSITQIMHSGDDPFLHGSKIVDPVIGNYGNNFGLVPYPGGVPWHDYNDGWTFSIWAKPKSFSYIDPLFDAYFIQRSGAVERMYLCGDNINVPGGNRGWNIVADYTTHQSDPIQFTADGLHNIVRYYDFRTGQFKFVANNNAVHLRDLSLGGVPYGVLDVSWSMLTVTYDGSTIDCYNSVFLPGIGFATTHTDTEPLAAFYTGPGGLGFGARNVTGTGDAGYSFPWSGSWDEVLMWNRALTPDEINGIPDACNGRIRFKRRYASVQPETHVKFERARPIKGASGTSVAWDVAGLYAEPGEPHGSAVSAAYQTVWFKWTPRTSGTVTFITPNSSPKDSHSASPTQPSKLFCTLTVWRGASLGSLVEEASASDSCTNPATFSAVAGLEYLIQVGTGVLDANGTAALTWG